MSRLSKVTALQTDTDRCAGREFQTVGAATEKLRRPSSVLVTTTTTITTTTITNITMVLPLLPPLLLSYHYYNNYYTTDLVDIDWSDSWQDDNVLSRSKSTVRWRCNYCNTTTTTFTTTTTTTTTILCTTSTLTWSTSTGLTADELTTFWVAVNPLWGDGATTTILLLLRPLYNYNTDLVDIDWSDSWRADNILSSSKSTMRWRCLVQGRSNPRRTSSCLIQSHNRRWSSAGRWLQTATAASQPRSSTWGHVVIVNLVNAGKTTPSGHRGTTGIISTSCTRSRPCCGCCSIIGLETTICSYQTWNEMKWKCSDLKFTN